MITISNPELYSTGVLLRLSNERIDEYKKYGESGSITNQKDLLLNFCKENHLKVYDIYSDDGESGAFYDRPEFVRMINDIDEGHVNLVVVKDLSRFGRVASGIDEYIEEYFQLKGIRFISVNENLDSKTSANFHDDIKFRAFFNEWFLRDCSKKTKDGKINKAKQGKVMTTYPKYGYKKDPLDKNHYIPDEETAPIVTQIFEKLSQGETPTDVAQWLNDANVPVPSKTVGNVHTRTVDEIKRKWTRTTVARIARCKTYLGYVINGKHKKLSYKSKKIMIMDEKDQIIKANMHQPLVDEETFNIVQQLMDSRTNTRLYKHDFLLKGLLECAECGKKLSICTHKRKDGSEVSYLRCNTYASTTRLKICTPHTNNCEKLTEEIIETIRKRLKDYLQEEKYFQLAKNVKDRTAYRKNFIQAQITSLNNKIEKLNRKIDQIYDDKLNEVIDVSDFERMYKTILDQKEETNRNIKELQKQKEDAVKEVDLNKLVNNFMNGKEITREMIVSIVDKITVTEDKKVKIYYKFSILNEQDKEENNVVDFVTA